MKKGRRESTKQMTLAALMTAVTCVLAPFAFPLPFSPIPITFATLALYFSLYVQSWKQALFSCFLYLAMGLVGIPVFSGFSAGFGKLTDPTGGFLLGYIFLILVGGVLLSKAKGKMISEAFGLAVATLVMYLFGALWLGISTGISWRAALMMGMLPYIPGDLLKIAAAVTVGPVLRKNVNKVI